MNQAVSASQRAHDNLQVKGNETSVKDMAVKLATQY